MSGRWWRAYNGARHDAKLLRLSDKHFRWWFNLICVAAERDGYLPDHADLCAEFRTSAKAMTEILDALVAAHLFDHDETGIRAHNWNERQYKSDVSNERVKRHRERKRNAESNDDVTLQKRPQRTDTETDTETESEKKDMTVAPSATVDDAQAVALAFAMFNESAKRTGWPAVQKFDDDRKKAMRARLREVNGVEGFAIALGKAEASRFLTETWGNFNLDWMLKPKNFRKLMEGNYDDRQGASNNGSGGRDGIASDFAYAANLLRDKQYSGL